MWYREPDPQRSFTLIELLVVIAVIAMLGALLLPAIRRASTSGRGQTTRALINEVGMALTQFQEINGTLPEAQSGVPSSNTLLQKLGVALTVKKTFKQAMDGKPVIIDGFAQPIIYDPAKIDLVNPDSSYYPLRNPKTYDLFSAGAYASQIPALGGSLPDSPTGFESTALARAGTNYTYDNYIVASINVTNKYIGNW